MSTEPPPKGDNLSPELQAGVDALIVAIAIELARQDHAAEKASRLVAMAKERA